MKNRKFLVLFIAVLLVVLSFTGCKKDKISDVKETVTNKDGVNGDLSIDKEQYLNLISNSEPSTLDASKGADSYSNAILNNVLEPLTRLEEDADLNNVLAPAGAESWGHNEDGTVWTFKIRDAKWSDGVAVRAQDYE